MHTSPRTRRFVRITGRAKTAHSCFHGCTLCAAQPSGSDRTPPHPCTVTAAHHLHTRPPDVRLEYQGSLVNTYSSLDLGRIPRTRPGLDLSSAFVVTCSDAGIDLPGSPRTMSDNESSAALSPLTGTRDIPHFIQDFFTALGLQYRWVVTRDVIGKTFVSAEDLDNYHAKEKLWMAVHEHERDLLEDSVYCRIQALWSDFSDVYAVFDENGPTQQFCAQKVWEALLNTFPLQHKQCKLFFLLVKSGTLCH